MGSGDYIFPKPEPKMFAIVHLTLQQLPFAQWVSTQSRLGYKVLSKSGLRIYCSPPFVENILLFFMFKVEPKGVDFAWSPGLNIAEDSLDVEK